MSALPGVPRQETRSALFPCLCSLLDKERHRRLCPWEAAQPDAKEFIDCVGNVWVADNWLDPQSCFAPGAVETKSTLCGGNRLVFVPVVLLPLAITGVFPHLLVTFTILDMSGHSYAASECPLWVISRH